MTIYKIKKQQGFITQHREISPLLCSNLNEVCLIYKTTESLCNMPNTNILNQLYFNKINLWIY